MKDGGHLNDNNASTYGSFCSRFSGKVDTDIPEGLDANKCFFGVGSVFTYGAESPVTFFRHARSIGGYAEKRLYSPSTYEYFFDQKKCIQVPPRPQNSGGVNYRSSQLTYGWPVERSFIKGGDWWRLQILLAYILMIGGWRSE